MPSSDQNLCESPRLKEALQLVSRRLDCRLSAAEEGRLKALEVEFPRETATFQRHCGNLRSAFRAMHVQPVGGSLITAIPLAERELLANEAIGIGRPLLQRTSVRAAIGAVVLTCGLLFAFSRIADNPAQFGADAVIVAGGEQNVPGAATADDAGVTPELASDVSGLAESAFPFAADLDSVTAEGLDAVRPLLQTDQWNIVVLKVSSKDRAIAMDQIQAILRSNGLSVRGLNKESGLDKSAWLGVVLTSAPTSNQKFIDDAILQGVAESADWEPREIAEASQKELINAIRRSLNFPTESELYHGEVYVEVSRTAPSPESLAAVTHPADGDTIADAGSNAKDGNAKSFSLPADPAPAVDNVPAAPGSETVLSNVSGVTLVVFQFQPDPMPAGNAESDGRI